jgi:hypothetical protein
MFGNTKYFGLGKLNIDNTIKRNQYNTIFEYKFDRKTRLIPKKNNKLTAIIFSENKSAIFLLRKFDNRTDTFRYNKGLYIIDNESIHLTNNGNRICFYLEGISTPLKMSNIERYTDTVNYIDLDGTIKQANVEKIKGLKYDSKIMDIICDRKLSENFTKIDEKFKYALLTFIFVIATMLITCLNVGISYYFR